MNTPNSRNHESGFTLVELLIVMSVILILMTLAHSGHAEDHHPRPRDFRHEPPSACSTRMEGQYASQLSRSTASPAPSPALGGKDPAPAPPSPDAAQLIPEDLASGNKAGYTFAITNCTNKTTINNVDQYNSYEITAVPNSVGHSGNRGFCMVENDQIHYDP